MSMITIEQKKKTDKKLQKIVLSLKLATKAQNNQKNNLTIQNYKMIHLRLIGRSRILKNPFSGIKLTK